MSLMDKLFVLHFLRNTVSLLLSQLLCFHRFGSPVSVVNAYIEDLDTDVLIRNIKRTKIIKKMAVIILAIVLSWTVALVNVEEVPVYVNVPVTLTV